MSVILNSPLFTSKIILLCRMGPVSSQTQHSFAVLELTFKILPKLPLLILQTDSHRNQETFPISKSEMHKKLGGSVINCWPEIHFNLYMQHGHLCSSEPDNIQEKIWEYQLWAPCIIHYKSWKRYNSIRLKRKYDLMVKKVGNSLKDSKTLSKRFPVFG